MAEASKASSSEGAPVVHKTHCATKVSIMSFALGIIATAALTAIYLKYFNDKPDWEKGVVCASPAIGFGLIGYILLKCAEKATKVAANALPSTDPAKSKNTSSKKPDTQPDTKTQHPKSRAKHPRAIIPAPTTTNSEHKPIGQPADLLKIFETSQSVPVSLPPSLPTTTTTTTTTTTSSSSQPPSISQPVLSLPSTPIPSPSSPNTTTLATVYLSSSPVENKETSKEGQQDLLTAIKKYTLSEADKKIKRFGLGSRNLGTFLDKNKNTLLEARIEKRQTSKAKVASVFKQEPKPFKDVLVLTTSKNKEVIFKLPVTKDPKNPGLRAYLATKGFVNAQNDAPKAKK